MWDRARLIDLDTFVIHSGVVLDFGFDFFFVLLQRFRPIQTIAGLQNVAWGRRGIRVPGEVDISWMKTPWLQEVVYQCTRRLRRFPPAGGGHQHLGAAQSPPHIRWTASTRHALHGALENGECSLEKRKRGIGSCALERAVCQGESSVR